MSKTYRTRPSEIYFIHDEVAAWCFDRAVNLFGSSLEAELRAAEEGAKNNLQAVSRRQRILAKWLEGTAHYKDPSSDGSITTNNSGPVQL